MEPLAAADLPNSIRNTWSIFPIKLKKECTFGTFSVEKIIFLMTLARSIATFIFSLIFEW